MLMLKKKVKQSITAKFSRESSENQQPELPYYQSMVRGTPVLEMVCLVIPGCW